MAIYTRDEARTWAREKLVGAVNCTIPTFTGDLERLNETAVRHDARLAVEHGFVGSLGVSEVTITFPEYFDFLRMIKAETGDELLLVHHASFGTLELNIKAVREAEKAGAEVVLLSYPPNFYPETEQDIFDYTKAVCDATNLAVILFPMYLWGFSPRIHPSDIPARLIRRLIDDCPNIAVIKAEGGFPSIQSVIECHRLFGDEVVISMPIEGELIPLSQVMPIQLSATSDHEYYGPTIPRVMRLLRDGKYDEAAEIYWQLHPARKIKSGLAGCAARWRLSQPSGLEVPGVAAGLQRRPAASAHPAHPRRADDRTAQGTPRRRPQPQHGPLPGVLHRTEPGMSPVEPDRTDPEGAIAAAAKRCSNWGRWGEDDVLGTLNFLDDAKRREGAALVRRGAAFSLAQRFDAEGPQKGWRRRTNPVHTMLSSGLDAEFGPPEFPHGLGGADDVIHMPLQASTQWDGLGHIFDHGIAYNGRMGLHRRDQRR